MNVRGVYDRNLVRMIDVYFLKAVVEFGWQEFGSPGKYHVLYLN